MGDGSIELREPKYKPTSTPRSEAWYERNVIKHCPVKDGELADNVCRIEFHGRQGMIEASRSIKEAYGLKWFASSLINPDSPVTAAWNLRRLVNSGFLIRYRGPKRYLYRVKYA